MIQKSKFKERFRKIFKILKMTNNNYSHLSERRGRRINATSINNIKTIIGNEYKRPKGKSIDLISKFRIVLLLETTHDSQYTIASKCNVSKATVCRINEKNKSI